MSRYHQRRADELEDEIRHTRAHLDETLHEIEERLSPQCIRRNVVAHMPSGDTSFLRNLGRSIRDHPLPILVTGVGLGWLVVSHLRAQESSGVSDQPMLPARQEAPQRMVAPHLGTQQGRGVKSTHRPAVVGEATHLGTRQGWSGYVYPNV
jgi:hypothetical protein